MVLSISTSFHHPQIYKKELASIFSLINDPNLKGTHLGKQASEIYHGFGVTQSMVMQTKNSR
jgi:hypothetical protein